MAASITQELGAFVASLTADGMPAEGRTTARMGFVDCIGVMIAGREEDAPRILERTLNPGEGRATLYFSGRRASVPEAAWINATAAHALDFDDVGIGGHPSTVLVPAILAEAEELDLTGAEMLTAYVAGYETWAELSLREPGSLHSKGWHPTGIWGAVAASAACASLRRLNAQQATMAIALGASQSAGVMANFGTMTKPFHAGRAAHAGIIAARLAEAGFTASPDAIEHPQGLLSAVSPGGIDRERPVEAGKTWKILEKGLNIKKFPACYCTHRAIDAILDLRRDTAFEAQSIHKIRTRVSDRFATILRNHRPQTGLEAKFSMEFAMASAALTGRVSLSELTDEFVRRPDVQALMERVELDLTQDYDPTHPNAAMYDQVHVELTGGETLESAKVKHARGHAAVPLTDQDLRDKFKGCLDYAKVEDGQALDLFERLSAMEKTPARALGSLH